MLLARSLLFTIAAHALGMVSMVLLLLPGMPGGGTADDAARMAYIAAHPWLWRLGWFPWQVTALSDLLLALALLRTREVPRLAAAATLVVTLVAIVPDQYGQVAWITKGIALASGEPSAYVAYEKSIFESTAVWGATFYTLGALGWTWCFSAAKLWCRPLTVLSSVLWPLFAVAALGPLFGLDPKLVAGANAVGFVLLEAWFVIVAEVVLRRSRPDESHGRYAPWRHPRFGWLDWLANSRVLRACGELVPTFVLKSDITDVVYVNYVVKAERLERLVPEGLELQRVGPGRAFAVFSFLTYRHGSLGPRFLGPLRRWFSSPLQSNWRIYVRDPNTGIEGVHFVTTAMDSTGYALGARMLCEGMPMHVFANADVGMRRVRLDPGRGTAPDCDARLEPAGAPPDGPWRACFATWRDMLAYVVPQDRAYYAQPWLRRVTRQEIDLAIALDRCTPLSGELESRAARAIVGDARPFFFGVESVRFTFLGERHEPLRSDVKTG